MHLRYYHKCTTLPCLSSRTSHKPQPSQKQKGQKKTAAAAAPTVASSDRKKEIFGAGKSGAAACWYGRRRESIVSAAAVTTQPYPSRGCQPARPNKQMPGPGNQGRPRRRWLGWPRPPTAHSKRLSNRRPRRRRRRRPASSLRTRTPFVLTILSVPDSFPREGSFPSAGTCQTGQGLAGAT